MTRSSQSLCLVMLLWSASEGCSRRLDPPLVESNSSPNETITNCIGMKLLLIPAGTFTMGSPIEEKERNESEVQHQVTISQDYYLGVTEVTQVQYEKVMGANPSYFKGNAVRGDSSNHPVEQVSWGEAVEFCKKLSDLPEEKKAGRVYRLPTEAEWEYACRAGSKVAYGFGEDSESLGDYAWFQDNSGRQTHPVGEKKANAWGLYDMHGNVYEWCSDKYGEYPKGAFSDWYGEYPKGAFSDWYDEYLIGAISDPSGPNEGSHRVLRGGSWYCRAASCRSADRFANVPSYRDCIRGFRVALSSSGILQSPEGDK